MQKIKKYLYYSIYCLIMSVILFLSIAVYNVDAHEVSKAEFVIELNSGKVFSSVNEDEILPMASTTKILTSLKVSTECQTASPTIPTRSLTSM